MGRNTSYKKKEAKHVLNCFLGEVKLVKIADLISWVDIFVLALIEHWQNNAWKGLAVLQCIVVTLNLLTDT